MNRIYLTKNRKAYKPTPIILIVIVKKGGEDKLVNTNFLAFAFKTFNLNTNTLTNRIAFQKSIYLMQELGSGTNFNFLWHNFGPYSPELATKGHFLNEDLIENSDLLDCDVFNKFKELKRGKEGDTRFLEMMADIIYLKKIKGISNETALFDELIRHRSYLNDPELFRLSIQRLKTLNLI